MLLPDINKRAERTLKSTLSCTRICLLFRHCWLLSWQKQSSVVITKGQGEVALASLSLRQDRCPPPDTGEWGNRGRGVKRVEAAWLYSWKRHHFLLPGVIQAVCSCLVPGSSELGCQPVSCGRVCKERTDCCSAPEKQKNQRTESHVAHVGSKTFTSLISRYVQPFSQSERVCLKSRYWNLLLHYIHLTWRAPLWNICKRQTVSPVHLCFCSLFDQSLGFSTWPLFWACLSLLSPGPALHLYFWHLPP